MLWPWLSGNPHPEIPPPYSPVEGDDNDKDLVETPPPASPVVERDSDNAAEEATPPGGSVD